MKFRVKNTVSRFGVGSIVYLPGDIVEGPEEWATINIHILEVIPEPKQTGTTAPQGVAIVTGEPVNVKEIIRFAEEEHEKEGLEEPVKPAQPAPKTSELAKYKKSKEK